jgi:hypothetical protein
MTSLASAAAKAFAAAQGSALQVSRPSLTSTSVRWAPGSLAMSAAASWSERVIGV